MSKTWDDPSLKPYGAKIRAAFKRGSRAEAVRLEQEQAQKQKELQASVYERLRTESPARFTAGLVELHARLATLSLTNRAERSAVLREVAAKLGELPFVGGEPVPGANDCAVTMGTVARHGLYIELRWVSFCDITRGFPALTQWLSDQGCRQFKYDLDGAGWNAGPDAGDEDE